MDIIKSCHSCHQDIHYSSSFDLKNCIDRDGNHVYQWDGIYDKTKVFIFCSKCIADDRHSREFIKDLCWPQHEICSNCSQEIPRYQLGNVCNICHKQVHYYCKPIRYTHHLGHYQDMCIQCNINTNTNNIYNALFISKHKFNYQWISDKVLLLISQYVRTTTIHRDYECNSLDTHVCHVCNKIYCSCSVIEKNEHLINKFEQCACIIPLNDGTYQCYECYPFMNIIKTCIHCDKELRFNSEFDLENSIDVNGSMVYQYDGIFDKKR